MYDGDEIYGHSTEGQKLHMMRANPFVCFEVEQIEDLANWRSVIAWGAFEEFVGDDARRARRRHHWWDTRRLPDHAEQKTGRFEQR